MADSKGPVAAILMKLKKPGAEGAPPPPDDGGGEMDGLRLAAEDLIDAVKTGDVEGVMAALRASYEHCSMPPPSEE